MHELPVSFSFSHPLSLIRTGSAQFEIDVLPVIKRFHNDGNGNIDFYPRHVVCVSVRHIKRSFIKTTERIDLVSGIETTFGSSYILLEGNSSTSKKLEMHTRV